MDNNLDIVFMTFDKRAERIGLWNMRFQAIAAKTTTFSIITVIATIVCLVIIYMFNTILCRLLLSCILINYIRTIMNVRVFTAIRTRLSLSKFIIMVGRQLINVKISRNIYRRMIEILQRLCIRNIQNDYTSSLKQWSELDNRISGNNEISDYWQKLGLNKTMLDKSLGIKFVATDPINPQEKTDYCIDLRDSLLSESEIIRWSKNWMRSDMSDRMHVMSIYKRLCPVRGKIDFKIIQKMKDIMLYFNNYLKIKHTDIETLINRALATKGTAGQLGKRSSYEDLWKNSQSKEALIIWKNIVENVLEDVFLINNIDSRIVQFMLYRKMEAINGVGGEPKPTRLMNAPNLVTRIVDSVCFTDFNDAVIEARFLLPHSLGINIFQELKLLHIRNPDYMYITCDFSDYDGTQHPSQGYAAGLARTIKMVESNTDIKRITYIAAKYRQHMFRQVSSTAGITYKVIGQQASGDITTSDDNTHKTAALMIIIVLELIKEGQVSAPGCDSVEKIVDGIGAGIIGFDITSDDSGIVCRKGEKFSRTQTRNIYKKIVESVGWRIKNESFSIDDMADDHLEYLSHGVEDRMFASSSKLHKITMRVLIRPFERAWGKFCISPEIENSLSTHNKSKLVSKYLTLAMVSLNNPTMMLASLYMITVLRCHPSEYSDTYSWQGIKAKTLNSVTLNNSLRLQATLPIEIRLDWIELKKEEVMNFAHIAVEFRQALDDLFLYQTRLKRPSFEPVVYDDNWWNVRVTLKYIENLFEQLDKHSLITGKKEPENWWTIKDQHIPPEELGNLPKNRGNIRYCEHITPAQQQYFGQESDSNYDIHIQCKTCYWHRHEHRYERINIKLT